MPQYAVPYSFCAGRDADVDAQIALISAEIQRLESLVLDGVVVDGVSWGCG